VNNTLYFISDIHLGLQDKETEEKKEDLLVKFLKCIPQEGSELYILGDLFDYWFEYKRVYQKGNYRTLAALKELTMRGIKVHYFIGNHDFFHNGFFEEEIGVNLYEEPVVREIDGKKFFLGHGDGLVDNDTGYNILKKILRNKFIQKLYALIHPDFGVYLASSTSRKSRHYTSGRPGVNAEYDGLFNAAKKKIDEGFDYVLFGHLHRRCIQKYKNGFYINLGSWLDKPCYGEYNDGELKIIDWK
jgi:UDP-2,3-diacylglucosamine hydrolase